MQLASHSADNNGAFDRDGTTAANRPRVTLAVTPHLQNRIGGEPVTDLVGVKSSVSTRGKKNCPFSRSAIISRQLVPHHGHRPQIAFPGSGVTGIALREKREEKKIYSHKIN